VGRGQRRSLGVQRGDEAVHRGGDARQRGRLRGLRRRDGAHRADRGAGAVAGRGVDGDRAGGGVVGDGRVLRGGAVGDLDRAGAGVHRGLVENLVEAGAVGGEGRRDEVEGGSINPVVGQPQLRDLQDDVADQLHLGGRRRRQRARRSEAGVHRLPLGGVPGADDKVRQRIHVDHRVGVGIGADAVESVARGRQHLDHKGRSEAAGEQGEGAIGGGGGGAGNPFGVHQGDGGGGERAAGGGRAGDRAGGHHRQRGGGAGDAPAGGGDLRRTRRHRGGYATGIDGGGGGRAAGPGDGCAREGIAACVLGGGGEGLSLAHLNRGRGGRDRHRRHRRRRHSEGHRRAGDAAALGGDLGRAGADGGGYPSGADRGHAGAAAGPGECQPGHGRAGRVLGRCGKGLGGAHGDRGRRRRHRNRGQRGGGGAAGVVSGGRGAATAAPSEQGACEERSQTGTAAKQGQR